MEGGLPQWGQGLEGYAMGRHQCKTRLGGLKANGSVHRIWLERQPWVRLSDYGEARIS
jgi:hypothetical protein